MNQPQTIFAIPTYRLRDVAAAIEAYDDNFWRNGHATKMMVFDDSSVGNHQKYYKLLEQTRTANELFYVGPREKEEFIQFLYRKLRDKKFESLVRNLFRPSYGGNRNFTLMYSLGHYLVSADDDMRPEALIEGSMETLAPNEMCRGKLHRSNEPGYVLVNFRPVVTKKNWRIDCGVAGYDNRLGLPPFFPTRLRFEDYIYRLWVQQPGIAAAHIDAVQHHTKNNYMRNPMAMEVFNEELCVLLKKKIKDSVVQRSDLGIKFRYNGEVSLADTEKILEKVTGVHKRVLAAADAAKDDERRKSLRLFAENLNNFQQRRLPAP